MGVKVGKSEDEKLIAEQIEIQRLELELEQKKKSS